MKLIYLFFATIANGIIFIVNLLKKGRRLKKEIVKEIKEQHKPPPYKPIIETGIKEISNSPRMFGECLLKTGRNKRNNFNKIKNK